MPNPPNTLRVVYYHGPLDGAEKSIPGGAMKGNAQYLNAGLRRITVAEQRERANMDHPPAIPRVVDVYVLHPTQHPAGPVRLIYAGQDVI